MTFKEYYAKKFNTYSKYVRYWHELTPLQQEQAGRLFSGLQMRFYVYGLGTDNNVNIRRRLHPEDNMAQRQRVARRIKGPFKRVGVSEEVQS